MILIATLGGIATLLFWGVADYLAGKSGQQIDAYLTNLIVQAVGVLMLLPVVLWLDFIAPSIFAISIVAMIGLLFTVAFVSFIKALTKGPFGIAAPLANSYALVTLLVSYLFLGFQASPGSLLALTAIILGVAILTMDRGTLNIRAFQGSTAYYAGMTAVLWGIGFALVDTVIDEFTWYELLFLMNVFILLFSFAYYILVHRSFPRWASIQGKKTRYAWLAGCFVTSGSMLFFATTDYAGGVVIPAVVASAAPLVTSFLAYYRDNEKLSFYKRFGALVVVAGLMLLNIV